MTAREAVGAWCGRAALGCALGVAVFALAAKRLFLHLGVPAAPEPGAVLGEVLAGAATLVGVLLALRALRRGARPGAVAAGVALVLLAPFVADALLALPARWLHDVPAQRVAFLIVTEALVLGALIAAACARRRGPSPAPPSPATLAIRRLATRVAIAVSATALALAAAELGLRAAGLGLRNTAGAMLIIPGDEHRIPLAELSLLVEMKPLPPHRFSSYYRPYAFFKGWYDRPTRAYFDANGELDYVLNRYGLRDRDFPLEKPAGELRIVAVGDSFTFGAGVLMEDTWPQVLEGELRARLGRPVEVVNDGVSGSFPALDEPWVLNQGMQVQPDILLVALNLNDMHLGIPMGAWETEPPPRQPLGGRWHLLNALQLALSPPPEPPRLVDVDALVRDEPQMWEETKAVLRRERDACGARGVRFVVAPLPMLSGLREQRWPYADLMKQVMDFCAGEGFETVDMASRFLGRVDQELWVHPMDQHPNEIAHRMIAEAVADALAPR